MFKSYKKNSKPAAAKPVKKKVSFSPRHSATVAEESQKSSAIPSPAPISTKATDIDSYFLERAISAQGIISEAGFDLANTSIEVLAGLVKKLSDVVNGLVETKEDLLENVEARHLMKSINSYSLSVEAESKEKLLTGYSPVVDLPKTFGKCVKWLNVEMLLVDKSQMWWAYYLASIALHWSNIDDIFCKGVAYDSEQFLNFIYEVLASSSMQQAFASDSKEAYRLIEFYLGTGHNLARVADVRPKLAEKKFVEPVRFYLNSKDQVIKCLAMIFLASIVNDKESEMLSDEYGVIPTLTKFLDASLDEADHMFLGFSTEELTLGVSLIVVNDSNKSKFVAAGLLPIIGRILQSGNEDEQARAVDCLWNLAFGENERQEVLKNSQIMDALKKLAASTKSALRSKSSKALNFIENGQANLSKLADDSDGVSEKKKKTQKSQDDGHIFISYSWKNQETCKRIRDLLKENSFRTWMDIDIMTGSTLQAMAEAIENAKVVLLCYSDDYHSSPNCRTEAEYMFHRQKPFIPVNMQRHYDPDGWLGLIIGSKFFIDMSLVKTPFPDAGKKLLLELNKLLNVIPKPEGPTTVSTHSAAKIVEIPPEVGPTLAPAKVPSTPNAKELVIGNGGKKLLSVSYVRSKIDSWTAEEVKNWLYKNSLASESKVATLLNDMNGRHLAVIYEMKVMAADIFYSTLLKCLGGSLVDVLKFSEALERLPSSLNNAP